MDRTLQRVFRTKGALLLVCLLLGAFAIAQEQGSGQSSQSASPTAQEPSAGDQDKGTPLARQLARDTREEAGEEEAGEEEAGEDENAHFKRSASVQLVAKITHLSLRDAYWLCLIINFAIIAGAILWVSRKNLPGFFRGRTAQIQQALEEARRASAEANQRLAEIGSRLSKLDAEIAEMRTAAEKEAAAEEARIKAAAEEDARKILQSAEQEIAAAAKTARRELKAYAASLAVSLAAKQIRVDSASDEALVRDFANQLGADGKRRSDN